jgi:chorismate-pyruvate lyase
MNIPVRKVGPDLVALFAQFPPAADLPDFEYVAPEAVPAPYHDLLVHEHHMTVTVEAYHGDLVDVRVVACRHDGESYARKIVLPLQHSGRIVLFGIVRINLAECIPEVRDAIVAARTPLGRILIEHDVLRRIETTAFLRINPGPKQLAWFDLKEAKPMYGRLAYIHCNERPAIELLEVVVPE